MMPAEMSAFPKELVDQAQRLGIRLPFVAEVEEPIDSIEQKTEEPVPRKTRKVLPHGTYGRYRQGCYCEPCKATNAKKQREYQTRRRARMRQAS